MQREGETCSSRPVEQTNKRQLCSFLQVKLIAFPSSTTRCCLTSGTVGRWIHKSGHRQPWIPGAIGGGPTYAHEDRKLKLNSMRVLVGFINLSIAIFRKNIEKTQDTENVDPRNSSPRLAMGHTLKRLPHPRALALSPTSRSRLADLGKMSCRPSPGDDHTDDAIRTPLAKLARGSPSGNAWSRVVVSIERGEIRHDCGLGIGK